LLKFFTRDKEVIEQLKEEADAVNRERNQTAQKLIDILDCAANATGDALDSLTEKKRVPVDRR
jgi:hypothetical protein